MLETNNHVIPMVANRHRVLPEIDLSQIMKNKKFIALTALTSNIQIISLPPRNSNSSLIQMYVFGGLGSSYILSYKVRNYRKIYYMDIELGIAENVFPLTKTCTSMLFMDGEVALMFIPYVYVSSRRVTHMVRIYGFRIDSIDESKIEAEKLLKPIELCSIAKTLINYRMEKYYSTTNKQAPNISSGLYHFPVDIPRSIRSNELDMGTVEHYHRFMDKLYRVYSPYMLLC